MATPPDAPATEEPTVVPAVVDRRPWAERYEDELLAAAVRRQEGQGP